MKTKPILFAIALFWIAVAPAWAQGPGNDKDKQDKKSENRYKYRENHKFEERKDRQGKEYHEKEDKDRDKDWEQRESQRSAGRKAGEILGRVILPRAGAPGPRQLAGVPRGHYPPPGECRIWYPNRPAGHQPPPVDCRSLAGIRLEPGAFILHGDQAYDAEYDWRQEERRRPGSVARDILDILFPPRR